MRKNILLILGFLAPFFLKAQENANATPNIPLDEEGIIRYKEVVKEPASKNDLFKRCVKWINKEYKNPSAVTPTRDLVNGKIVIRHTFRIKNALESGTEVDAGNVMYEMIIRFKDNRYRVEMTNFVLKKTSRTHAERWLDKSDPMYHPNYIAQLDEFAHKQIASLKDGMKPPKKYKEEDW